MKRIFLWMVFILGTLTSFAQNKSNIIVSGTVVEADTKEPVSQATIQLLSLPDSTFVAGVATNSRGRFTLPKVTSGKYVLKASYIGFRPATVALSLTPSNPALDIGSISLLSDAVMLQEAVITAEAPPVTVKEDTVVYAASAYRTAEGAMLEELVKKLPGAEVSDDGKITINGKEVKKIMVDGKEFFSDDPQVSMKNLPVNMVENVKAYDRKSDMARITGIDDGDEETVLDLTVKKGMKQGWIGNLIAGVGNKDRYEGGIMLSRFTDNSSISIVGSMNNTNNRGFSEFGDAGEGLGGGNAGAGITAAKSLGVNFAHEKKNFQIGGNVQYGYSDNDAQSKRFTEEFLNDGESAYQDGTYLSRRKRHDVRADFRLEWRPDTMTTIIFRPNASYSKTDAGSSSLVDNLNNDSYLLNRREVSSKSNSENYSFNGRLQVFRRLNSKGRNVFVGGNFGYSDSESESESHNLTEFFKDSEIDPDSIADIFRTTDRNSDNRNWSVSASYTEPVFKNHFLQARYEFSHRKRLSQSLVSDLDSVMPNNYVESLSSRVENFYDSHTAELSLRGVYPKMMYNAGIGLIPQTSKSETTIGPNSLKQLPTQNVVNFAPQLMFRYMFNKQHVLMFRYRGRSSAPDVENLQEVIDQTDPMNIRYGNPNLKPSFNHNLMLFYNRYVASSMRSYSFNLFYSNTQNSISDKMTYDKTTGGRVYEKVNINGNWNARGFFSFNTPLKNKKFTISSNTNVRLSDAVGYVSVSRMDDAVLSTTHNLLLGEKLIGNYRSDNFDISLNASVNYDLTRNNEQDQNNKEAFLYNFGGSTNITLPWQLALTTDLNYRIKDGYTQGYNINELIWNAQISKNFLKNNMATLRIKFYDILKEQSNLSRTIDATRMTDSEYNTLGSYFMVHFVYRLNTLGGKSRGSGRGEGFGPGGERRMGPPPGGAGGGGGRRHF